MRESIRGKRELERESKRERERLIADTSACEVTCDGQNLQTAQFPLELQRVSRSGQFPKNRSFF